MSKQIIFTKFSIENKKFTFRKWKKYPPKNSVKLIHSNFISRVFSGIVSYLESRMIGHCHNGSQNNSQFPFFGLVILDVLLSGLRGSVENSQFEINRNIWTSSNFDNSLFLVVFRYFIGTFVVFNGNFAFVFYKVLPRIRNFKF